MTGSLSPLQRMDIVRRTLEKHLAAEQCGCALRIFHDEFLGAEEFAVGKFSHQLATTLDLNESMTLTLMRDLTQQLSTVKTAIVDNGLPLTDSGEPS